jgi:DNA modification methylase
MSEANAKPGASKTLQEPSIYQSGLFADPIHAQPSQFNENYYVRLDRLLSDDLNFHGNNTSYASHDFHAFPAKFPPQLPRLFIHHLTQPGEVVLDPMMGSGTAVVEGYLTGRRAIGVNIDPLAKLITQVKVTPLDVGQIVEYSNDVVKNALQSVAQDRDALAHLLQTQWNEDARKFINYWFAPDTQLEIVALLREIRKITNEAERAFFELALSACIITKSGGVSLAFDLAHTRPHRAKITYSYTGEQVLGNDLDGQSSRRVQFLTKNLRSAIAEFRKRCQQNIKILIELPKDVSTPARVYQGDAQNLPLDDGSIDLIITSPPYASNAIDYMRANRFSLVWLGYPMDELNETRKQCIGGENVAGFAFEAIPPHTVQVVDEISQLDAKKGQTLRRYYSEMTRILREMYRVLKPGKAAIVVVASSVMRNRDIETDQCLAEIGRSIGFDAPKISIRRLDRNRRMMPAGHKIDGESQIQKRMHEEFVIGFYKLEKAS